MTTYQEVWNLFKAIGRVNDTDLPTSDEGIYAIINASRMTYNSYLDSCVDGFIELLQDDTTETFNKDMIEKEKQFLAECIKLTIIVNMYSQFVSDMQVFQSSIGVRDYRSQVSSRETLVKLQEKRIDELLSKLADEFEE